jgi:hypothetical protein
VRLLILAALLAVHLLSVPLTLWEFDETFFALGVERYEPLLHHPPPPGYPLFIGFAKLVHAFTGDPFRALIVVSVLATACGIAALYAALRRISGDDDIALFATVLFYVSPVMLVHGVVGMSDSGALALLALSLWLSCREGHHVTDFALACAATVGWRPQFSIVVVPLLLLTIARRHSWKERLTAIGVFGAACLAWLVPLMMAAGGATNFVQWLGGQAAYFAAHDADLSRSGMSHAQVAFRFIAHPWGPKYLSFVVLLAAAAGVVLAMRARVWRTLPLAIACAIYLAFAIVTMDPADAPRYALPSMIAVALFAAWPLARLRAAGWIALALYAAGAYVYTSPILVERRSQPSPPVAAARFIERTAPRNAVILYDLPLRPHAEYLLRDRPHLRIDEGFARYGRRIDVPLVLYADGETKGTSFAWRASDAYGKLTRNFYRVVTVSTIGMNERYAAVRGIFAPERSRTGESWRWLGPNAELSLPDIAASRVRLTFRLPPESVLDANAINVGSTSINVARGATATIEVPFAPNLTITAARSFVPAETGGSRDRRRLSVMLLGVEQTGRR